MDPLQALSQEWQTFVGGGAATVQKAVEAVELEAHNLNSILHRNRI